MKRRTQREIKQPPTFLCLFRIAVSLKRKQETVVGPEFRIKNAKRKKSSADELSGGKDKGVDHFGRTRKGPGDG